MSRNNLSWDDATTAARVKRNGGTHSRIFGDSPNDKPKKVIVNKKPIAPKVLDWHEEEALLLKLSSDKKKSDQPKQLESKSPTKSLSSKEIGAILDEEIEKLQSPQPSPQQSPSKPEARQGLDLITHGIRYSSFMDEDLSNANKIRDQKLQQKQWLDEQMAARKSIDRKNKLHDKEEQESNNLYDQRSLSQQDRYKVEKHDMQNQIREYNEVMAMQKRAKDKMIKEDDKQNAFNYQAPKRQQESARKQLENEIACEMIEKEQKMSRDMRNMNTQN